MWPFKRQKNPIIKNSDDINIDDYTVEIPSMGFIGTYEKSSDGSFLVAWSDFDTSHGVGGYRKAGKGPFVLVKNGKVVYKGKLERPNDGKAANTGTFVLADWLFGDDLKSIFYAFASDGSELIRQTFSANMLNTGLSESGQFAVAQLANSNSEDSGCLAFFDLLHKKLLWKQVPIPGWAETYMFNDQEKRLGLVYQDKGIYEYTYTGDFVDFNRWEKDRIKFASGFEIVSIVQEKLEKSSIGGLKQEDAEDLINMLTNALKNSLNDYPNEQAKAHRIIGEIYEKLGDLRLAIQEYELAIKLNPKVGLKRQLEKLKKMPD